MAVNKALGDRAGVSLVTRFSKQVHFVAVDDVVFEPEVPPAVVTRDAS